MHQRLAVSIRVYPRVGGGNDGRRISKILCEGLSPRGRGKLKHPRPASPRQRSIPAWAGETLTLVEAENLRMVYPRVGGGNLSRVSCDRCSGGLSPRGRGKPSPLPALWRTSRSIPAWAGETSQRLAIVRACEVYPRVGGGNPTIGLACASVAGLSPRGRGKRIYPSLVSVFARSIPAWAGETKVKLDTAAATAVYPRVGGGNSPLPGTK